MQNHEKNTHKTFAEFALPTEAAEAMLLRLLRELNEAGKTLPGYEPLKDYTGIELQATLAKLAGLDDSFGLDIIIGMLHSLTTRLVKYYQMEAISKGEMVYNSTREADMLIELIRFFTWQSHFGCRPAKEQM